ncbi:MAG: flavodoxin family protein [Spirochaetales bacterium]|nr:flavodoxin family protein [Spirochaetales bacterium]
MRVCVLFCGRQANDRVLKELATKLADGISSNGHTVEVFDMNLEMGKIISLYDYVVVISTATSYFSKYIPDNVSKFLKAAGSVSGKRCSCYISKNCGRKARVLQTLMSTMESEGMYLKVSDILPNGNYAYAVGKRLHVDPAFKE